MRYPVVIHKDPKSDYGVTVPDLPGCFSAGSTIDEALSGAVEAIELHLEGMLADHEPIPQPQGVEKHRRSRQWAKGVWALVTVDPSKLGGKAKRVNVTLPERLLALMDRHAKKSGESRSGLIAQAAMEYISAASEE